MSLELYLGVPGSGKSYHTAKRVYEALRAGKNVISSLNINTNLIKPISDKKPLGNFIYVPDRFWFNNAVYEKTSLGGKVQSKEVYSYIYGLYNFALQFHKRNARGQMIEGQTLLILDEAYKFFDPREWNRKDRKQWVRFFTIFRHYGYDVLLISQTDISIDKQIRGIVETRVLHRRVTKYKLLGKILAAPFGGHLFMCIESMNGMSKKDGHIRSYLLYGGDFYFSLYDSFVLL